MLEQKTRKVDIKDIGSDVMTELLSFIYTGNTLKLDEMAVDLLVASEKYQILNLKSLCEESIGFGLNVAH